MQQDISPATGNQAQVAVVCSPDSLLPIPALRSDALHEPLFPSGLTVTKQCLRVCWQQLLETVRAVFLSERLLCLRIETVKKARTQFVLAEQRSNPWVQMWTECFCLCCVSRRRGKTHSRNKRSEGPVLYLAFIPLFYRVTFKNRILSCWMLLNLMGCPQSRVYGL